MESIGIMESIGMIGIGRTLCIRPGIIVPTSVARPHVFVNMGQPSNRSNSRRCWVPGCRNATTRMSEKLFTFPTNVKRCRAWLKAVGDEKLAQMPVHRLTSLRFVCREHFLPNKITPAGRPAEDAVPVFNVGPPLSEECLRKFDETVGLVSSEDPLSEEMDQLTCNDTSTAVSDAVGSTSPLDIPDFSAISDHTYSDRMEDRHHPGDNPPASSVSTTVQDFLKRSDHTYSDSLEEGDQGSDSSLHVIDMSNISIQSVDDISNQGEDANVHIYKEVAELQDSTSRDHNYYLGNGSNGRKRHILERQQEEHSFNVLENVKKELCRICGQKGQVLMPICETSFAHVVHDMPLSAKVELHLPLKVDRDDKLPLHICETCADLLNRWHELYVTCVAADAVLQKTFGMSVPVELPDESLSRKENWTHDDEQLATNNSVPLEEPTDQSEASCTLSDSNNQCREVCEKCGRGKSGETEKEQIKWESTFENSEMVKFSYVCKMCCESFTTQTERKRHFRMCSHLSSICEVCGAEVLYRKDLNKHKTREHMGIKPQRTIKYHMCDRCAKCFSDKHKLVSHLLVHERGATPSHFCYLCCRTFYFEHYYNSHMKKHEEGKIKTSVIMKDLFKEGTASKYVCPVCKQIFDNTLSLITHLTTRKEMNCPSCHMKILNERRLILHRCKVFSCRYCSKSFCTQFRCEYHERIHIGEEPYKCSICHSVFRTKTLKLRHERRHNSNSFLCCYCKKQYRNKYLYREHVNCHFGQYVSCEVCNKRFSSRKTFRRHARTFHGFC